MPTYLDFDSTKKFRDYLINRTLKSPNGPQTFTKDNYEYQKLSDYSNIDPGDVVNNIFMNREDKLKTHFNFNLYAPVDGYSGLDRVIDINNINKNGLPLRLYPNFNINVPKYNLIGILNSDNYVNESKLFQFAANHIKNDPNGPILSRISQNFEKNTTGKVRLLDALNGNTSTAINLVTGKEPLVEFNNSITVAKTIPGKGIDFLERLSGIETPFSQIPGDYLTNPMADNKKRPTGNELVRTLQDTTGAIGSLIGIQRRPTETRKPSDLFIEYMGQGPKQQLFNLLSFSKYAPNYTTTARSQNTSKLFNFVDDVAQGVKNVLGVEAPAGVAYIGDDRGNSVYYAMNDFNDRVVRSPYYLSLMFDETATRLFHQTRAISDGGSVGGDLTWYSKNSKTKLGTYNEEYNSEGIQLESSLSSKYNFRESSILWETQELLNSMPADGSFASHVGNVINQTSRSFKEGDTKISKGSAIVYVDKYNKDEAGIEYCRVWTKDRPYTNYSDTMKRTGNIRKFDSSVMGGQSRPWNLNYAPMSNGKTFEDSTNISDNWAYGSGLYAKKYMFSIENLAWKTSNTDGYRVSDLPVCERGANGGRVMWFPPYDLKISEQNNAKWDDNIFLGRPEPVYTYSNTSRAGQVSFKVVVDHPSILNLLVHEHFKGMDDQEADNYINAFFAGCEEIDFYDLIQKYTTLNSEDVNLILSYLNSGKSADAEYISNFKKESTSPVKQQPKITNNDNVTTTSNKVSFKGNFYFENDTPYKPESINTDTTTNQEFNELYYRYFLQKNDYKTELRKDLLELLEMGGESAKKDRALIMSDPNPLINSNGVPLTGSEKTSKIESIITNLVDITDGGFNDMQIQYELYKTTIEGLITAAESNKIINAELNIITSSSAVGENEYNFYLGVRRGYSILSDFFTKFSKSGDKPKTFKWFTPNELVQFKDSETPILKIGTYKLTDFGYDGDGSITINFKTKGEKGQTSIAGNNFDCGTDIKTKKGLKKTAPIAFFCRQANVNLTYTTKNDPIIVNNQITPEQRTQSQIENVSEITRIEGQQIKKPSINVMQRIIMKTLSEGFYFKKLEESSPLVFKSLVEKLKYFHPGFHSTTPEGLNSRLTFLLQCVRPGDTIPVKGLSEQSDIGARNTSFGPPPICVLRIGDFYHSKIIIRDVNITYDEGIWDLNPEGIGIQPMIATVNLSVNFIGGQGLDKPVERLQNALSSNFFANTEMYDERAKITSTINQMDEDKFTKEFLDVLMQKPQNILISQDDTSRAVNYISGSYIGGNGGILKYDDLINRFYENADNYLKIFGTAFNMITTLYGNILTPLFFSSSYRKMNEYIVYKPLSSETITLLGEYTQPKDDKYYLRVFKQELLGKISNTDILQLIGLNRKLIKNEKYDLINESLIIELNDFITNIIDDLSELNTIKELENSRNGLIRTWDDLNFLIKYGHDCKIDGVKTYQGALNGFSTTALYNEYEPMIVYLKQKQNEIVSKINTTLNFEDPNIDNTVLKQILSVFLNNYVKVLEIIEDILQPNENELKKITNKYNEFISMSNGYDFKLNKKLNRKNGNKLEFEVTESEITSPSEISEVLQLWSTKSQNLTKLNYLRK